MHFLFISSIFGPQTGGIETLIARMSRWLIGNGHRVTLLSNSSYKFRELFPNEMRIVDLGSELQQFSIYHKAKKRWPDLQIDRPDVIKSFHLIDSWISSILSSIIKPTPKLLFGNYFPYHFKQSRNPLKHFTHRPYLHNLRYNFPDNSILCMDEEQISQFRQVCGKHRNPIFWPLPVNNPNKNEINRTPKWCHIVSVSRLEPMKKAKLYMVEVIDKLRKKGYPVTWSVYGEGSLEGEMKAKISSFGLNEVISMKGKLPYSEYANAMQDAYLFLGGGTAVVEAAFCGVPGVLAFAEDISGDTYGSLYNFPFGNLGVRTDIPPGTTVEAEVERIFKLQSQEYEEEIRKTIEYAQGYSMDNSMDKFLGFVEKASAPKISYGLFYYYYVHRLVEVIWQEITILQKRWKGLFNVQS